MFSEYEGITVRGGSVVTKVEPDQNSVMIDGNHEVK